MRRRRHRAEDVAPFDHGGRHYAIYRTEDDRYFATDGLCTHEQIHLADGFVKGTIIECPKHNGRFDFTTGEAKGAPVCIDLKTYPVKVDGRPAAREAQLTATKLPAPGSPRRRGLPGADYGAGLARTGRRRKRDETVGVSGDRDRRRLGTGPRDGGSARRQGRAGRRVRPQSGGGGRGGQGDRRRGAGRRRRGRSVRERGDHEGRGGARGRARAGQLRRDRRRQARPRPRRAATPAPTSRR